MTTVKIQESRVQEMQKQIDAARTEVSKLTGYSLDEITMMFFDYAYTWLELVTGNDPAAEHIPKTREFWGFWKKTWYNADTAFIAKMKEFDVRTNLKEMYQCFHRVTPDNRHINNSTVDAEYHSLIKILAKER